MTGSYHLKFNPEPDDVRPGAGCTSADIDVGRRALSRLDLGFERLSAILPPFVWRARPPNFASLARIIVGQHVSTRSADAMWKRLAENIGEVTVASILEAETSQLGEAGLTQAKSRSIVAIAMAIHSGSFDLERVSHMTDLEASAYLRSMLGVGTWTADVYLLTCERRRDVFPVGDVALREAVRLMDCSPLRLSADELAIRSQKWHPFRGIAAHMLWAYYRMKTERTVL